jgi:hypothetical protein
VEFLIPVVAVAGVLALIGGILAVSSRMEQQRTEALAAASQTMGFAFEPDGDLEVLMGFGDLPLYGRGHSKKVKNVMTGQAGDRDVKLFDYKYTTGGGKDSHTWSQTVALFPKAGEGLPDLLLAPENVFHKIGAAFGYQDIDFDTSPDFSSHYLLRGPDEMAIRSAFSADALNFFGQQRGWHVEVASGNVGVYRSGKRCKPDDLRTFLEGTQSVLRVLARE